MVAEKIATVKNGGNRKSDQSANLQTDLTVSQAAELMTVSDRAVHHARTVRRQGIPELIEKVETGDVKVSVAADVAARHQSTITGYCFFILVRRFIQSSRDSV